MNLKAISGAICFIGGAIGGYIVMDHSSAAVTWPFLALGAFAFLSLGMYGINKFITAVMQATVDFQVNS